MDNKSKEALVEKLSIMPEIHKITIKDTSGFHFSTLGVEMNGIGPVTILIIPSDGGGVNGEDHR